MVHSQVGEGFRKVGDEVIPRLGLDNHVVNISFHVAVELGLQTFLDHPLVRGTSIFETESHGLVAVDTVRRNECRFVLVGGIKGYLVIP